MRPVMHTTAASATELRAELLHYLERQITVAQAMPPARTLVERAARAGQIAALQEVFDFWTNMVIETSDAAWRNTPQEQ